MYLTQDQIDVLGQNLRKKHLRIELLDNNMHTIDSIAGLVVDGSITATADNDIRRSGTITMAIPTNSSGLSLLDKLDGYSIEVGGKIWLDKYIKIYVGINNLIGDEEIIWYKLGVFLINEPVRNFSSTEYSISFDCIDLMAKLTGQRQGQLTGITTLIEKGYNDTDAETGEPVYVKTKLFDVLVSTITELGGFTRYLIYPIPDKYKYLPYDIKLGIGSTVYDILKEINNILSTWQMYFDLDGVFICEPIPSGKNGIVYNLEKTHYISDSLSVSFENVKNQIVIYGRANSLTYYCENDESNTNVIYQENEDHQTATLVLKYETITASSLTINGSLFGFKSLAQVNALPINAVEIWSGGTKLIYSHDNIVASLVKFENSKNSFGKDYPTAQIEAGTFLQNEIYFIRIFDASLNSDKIIDLNKDIIFEFMGKQQVSYSLVNDNKESPFYINAGFSGVNYYCGLATTPSDKNWGEEYELVLNNDEILSQLEDGTIITFMANALNIYADGLNATTVNIKVRDPDSGDLTSLLSHVPIVQNVWTNQTRMPVPQNKLSNDYTIWELKFEANNGNPWFVLNGINRHALTKVLSSGEYDNIYSDQLAYERCLWELFNTSNLNDNIVLGVVPNYLLDVNCKIEHDPTSSLPITVKKDRTEEPQYYIIKSITYPLGVDTTPQNITAARIYDSGNLVGED